MMALIVEMLWRGILFFGVVGFLLSFFVGLFIGLVFDKVE